MMPHVALPCLPRLLAPPSHRRQVAGDEQEDRRVMRATIFQGPDAEAALLLCLTGQHVLAAGPAADVPVVLDVQDGEGRHRRGEFPDRVLAAGLAADVALEGRSHGLGDGLLALLPEACRWTIGCRVRKSVWAPGSPMTG